YEEDEGRNRSQGGCRKLPLPYHALRNFPALIQQDRRHLPEVVMRRTPSGGKCGNVREQRFAGSITILRPYSQAATDYAIHLARHILPELRHRHELGGEYALREY